MPQATPIANTPEPPYWAVIFTSLRTDELDGYDSTAERMLELAAGMGGFLGFEAAHEGVGITISYWSDLDSIAAWKRDVEHLAAQGKGRTRWYRRYVTRIARVERDYSFERGAASAP